MKNDILFEIIGCQEVIKAKEEKTHPCHEIVTSQTGNVFQVPEPWNGNIETAKILFISSNPSYDENEDYPNGEWDKEKINSFFTDRLRNAPKDKWSTYWKAIYKWAGWILPDCKDITANIALTEIVHCKSRTEYGVKECRNYCAEKWLEEVLSCFTGGYIVLVGKVAQQYCGKIKEFANGKIIIQTPHIRRPVKGLTDKVRKRSFYDQMNNGTK